jgi:glycosyltransferase involved in cell wall biosynthesis
LTTLGSGVRQKLTVICPVFNEAAVVPLFFQRMRPVIDALDARGYDVEVMFLNNASTDDTLRVILDLREQFENLSVTRGHSSAGCEPQPETSSCLSTSIVRTHQR